MVASDMQAEVQGVCTEWLQVTCKQKCRECAQSGCKLHASRSAGSVHRVVASDMQAGVQNTVFINKDIIEFPKKFYSCDIFSGDLMLQGL